MYRFFAVAFLMLLWASSTSAGQETLPQANVLMSAPLPDRERVTVLAVSADHLLVSISGPSVLLYFGGSPSAPTLDGLQVWLLKSDGTAVRRLPGVARGFSRSSNNEAARSVGFKFEPVPAADLAAVVVQAHGKLSVHDIAAK